MLYKRVAQIESEQRQKRDCFVDLFSLMPFIMSAEVGKFPAPLNLNNELFQTNNKSRNSFRIIVNS